MNFNEIRLPAFAISSLYKYSLVLLGDEKKIGEPKAEVAPKFLGGNNKNILLVVKNNDTVFVNDRQLSFLTKLLEACKMNIGDVAIINNAKEQVAIAEIKKEFSPKSIILFDINPTTIKLPIDFPMFKLQEYDGSIYLCAPSLNELDDDSNEGRILKSKLWVCFKKLFDL